MTAFFILPSGQKLAYNRIKSTQKASLSFLFCGGFRSDMNGSKAQALDSWCKEKNYNFVRFDYLGHGSSDLGLYRWHDRSLERECGIGS